MTTLTERTATPQPRAPRDDQSLPFSARTRAWIGYLSFAALVYVPILLMDMGKVEADTKSYLYLDPGRFLAGAASMWDPHIGLGTVSHQTLGYLFPLGPFYWILEVGLRMPAWVAQRIWLGSLIFLAGLGMRYLLRALQMRGPGVPVAVLAYAFTPYVLEYSARLSVLLSPWAALPWLIAFVVLGLRRGGWKYAALFALTVQLVSSINASALVFALIGPALWFPFALWGLREVDWRRTWTTALKISLLTILTSLWWMAGLAVQGKYGLNVLRFTESIPTVSATSFPYEILRGLGYWFFYGRDRTGLWNDAMFDFTQSPGLIFTSLLIPTLALASAAFVRWRHRAFAVMLVLFGLVIAVAAAPYNSPSPVGSVFKAFSTESTAGFALRSTNRAAPLIVLGFAMLLAAGVTATYDYLRARDVGLRAIGVGVLVGAICIVNSPGIFGGRYYSAYLERDEQVPQYWQQALSDLDAQPHDTRVLALPGADFAAYRWGDTIDPIEPGLMDRPYVARELVPWGSEPAANLLQALDRRLQENVFEPDSLAPVARLMGVGDVLLREDLQTDRFTLAPAGAVWRVFTTKQPKGLDPPKTYGTTIPGKLMFPEIGVLSRPPDASDNPPPVAVLHVQQPLSIVRTKPADSPLVVDGDGEGLMNVSGAGLLDANRAVIYSAAYEKTPSALRALPADSALVVTDTNRRRAERWAQMSFNYGYTEQAGEKPLAKDILDQRLDVFPGSTDESRTVTVMNGVKSVQATRYGTNSFGYTTEERPSQALDGDLKTAWLVDDGDPVGQEHLHIVLDHPVTADHINFVQPSPDNARARYISKVTLTFDKGTPVHGTLDQTSKSKQGEDVKFATRTFSSVDIRIDAVHQARGLSLAIRNGVGFAEVRIPDGTANGTVKADEVARLPQDLLDALGTQSASHPLAIVMSRDLTMDKHAMNRQFTLPTTREFAVSGTAQLSASATDDVIDRALGLPDAAHGGITATSSQRLEDPAARASAALDDDPTTAWNTPLNKARGVSMRVQLAAPTTFDHLDLQLVADGQHSVANQLQITSDDGTTRTVSFKSTPTTKQPGNVVSIPVSFAPLHGTTFTFKVTGFTPLTQDDLLMPVGIAELGIPGVHEPAPAAQLAGTCTDGLVSIDGRPVPVRVVGSTADALRSQPLKIEPCTDDQISLASGTHVMRSAMAPRNHAAFDVGRITLASAPAGASAAATATPAATTATVATPASTATAPAMRVVHQDRTSMTVKVEASSSPFWLVLGESHNAGWKATIGGKSLGAPQLLDGYANGWLVQPGAARTISVEWTPQRSVRGALVISLLATLGSLGIVAFAYVRRRRARRSGDPGELDAAGLEAEDWPVLSTRLIGAPLARRPRATAAVVVAGGLVAGAVVQPWLAPVVAGAIWLAIARPRWRAVLRVAPMVLLGAVAVLMPLAQIARHYPPRFDWPDFFQAARIPAWLAILFLAADALIGLVWSTEVDESDAGH